MEITKTRDVILARNSDLTESRFTDVKLTKSSFDDVNLQGSSFTNINLGGARLVDVNLAGVTVERANLTGLQIDGILVTDMIRAYKSRAQVVLYAKHLAGMQHFYQSLFLPEVEHAAPDHVVLTSSVSRLIIVQTPQSIAANIQITDPPTRRSETPIKLVFEVKDIGAARAAAPDLGGRIDAEYSEWTYQGSRVCDGQDPEGNVVQLRMTA
jgi:uncharacterized protein YjbI with pentapeptide repeats